MRNSTKYENPRISPKRMKIREQALKRAFRKRQAGGRIDLYQKESDPGSHVVRARLTELGLDYTAHSVPDGHPVKHEELTLAGGKDQVPFLIDHRTGVKLYEPEPILEYLDKEYGRPVEGSLPLRFAHELENRIKIKADEIAWAIRVPWDHAENAIHETAETIRSLRRSYRILREALRGRPSQATRVRSASERATGRTISKQVFGSSGRSRNSP